MFIIDPNTSIAEIKNTHSENCGALNGVLPEQLRMLPAWVKTLQINITDNKQVLKILKAVPSTVMIAFRPHPTISAEIITRLPRNVVVMELVEGITVEAVERLPHTVTRVGLHKDVAVERLPHTVTAVGLHEGVTAEAVAKLPHTVTLVHLIDTTDIKVVAAIPFSVKCIKFSHTVSADVANAAWQRESQMRLNQGAASNHSGFYANPQSFFGQHFSDPRFISTRPARLNPYPPMSSQPPFFQPSMPAPAPVLNSTQQVMGLQYFFSQSVQTSPPNLSFHPAFFPPTQRSAKRSYSTADLQAVQQPQKRQRTHLVPSPSSGFEQVQLNQPAAEGTNQMVSEQALRTELEYWRNNIVPNLQRQISDLTSERDRLLDEKAARELADLKNQPFEQNNSYYGKR